MKTTKVLFEKWKDRYDKEIIEMTDEIINEIIDIELKTTVYKSKFDVASLKQFIKRLNEIKQKIKENL